MKDIFWLAKNHRKAYDCLPEAYREDNCLNFFKTKTGTLVCQPREDQRDVLGNWHMAFAVCHVDCDWSHGLAWIPFSFRFKGA